MVFLNNLYSTVPKGKHGCVPDPLTVEIQGGAIWAPPIRNRGIETPIRNRVKFGDDPIYVQYVTEVSARKTD